MKTQTSIAKNRILIIDQDPAFCVTITGCLTHEGFEVTSLHNGEDGLKCAMAPDSSYDLILLDTMLPGMNGFEVLKRIRSAADTPVIMMTGPSQKILHIVGFEMGADDFLAKPCNPRELAARVRAILRRTKNYLNNEAGIVLGDIELDVGTRVVRRKGEELQLTSAEFKFLEILLKAAGHIISREQLAQNALGRDLGIYDRSVDMHISRLRKKLGPKYNGIERIKTIRGFGFVYTIQNPYAA